jgi:hypothetical protein
VFLSSDWSLIDPYVKLTSCIGLAGFWSNFRNNVEFEESAKSDVGGGVTG